MAEILDSFDDRVTADIADKYNAYAVGTGMTHTITSAAGRNGTNGLRVASTGALGTSTFLVTMPNATRYKLAWAATFSTLPLTAKPRVIAYMRDTGAVQCNLTLNPNGTLSITRNGTALTGGTSALAITAGLTYHFEWDLTVDNTTGSSALRVNGSASPWISLTGQDTQATAVAQINEVGPVFDNAFNSAGSCNYDIDDVIIHDGASFVGDLRIDYKKESGAGNYSEWTPNGAATLYESVDDTAQDGDTTYASSSTLNQRQTFAFENIPTSATVKFVQHVIYAKKTDAGARGITPMIRQGGTDYLGTEISPGTTYQRHLQMVNVDPATAVAWTGTGFNSAEIGDKITT